MRPIRLLGIALTLIAAGCTDTEDETASAATPAYIDATIIPELQEMATAACLCDRSNGSQASSSCWREFDTVVARYQHESWASACGVASSSMIAFAEPVQPGADEFGNSKLRVTTEFAYGACSAEEASAKAAEYEREEGSPSC